MQNVELRDLNLTSKWRSYLIKANFITASEVLLTPPNMLSNRTRLPPNDISQLLQELALAVSCTPHACDNTVSELAGPRRVVRERAVDAMPPDSSPNVEPELCREKRSFTLGDAALDMLLGDGIQLGTITELAGQSASGKSHLCLQAALTAQLPPALGGVAGGTIFISSEGSVPSSRLLSLASALCSSLGSDTQDESTPWSMLDNVHMEKAPDVETLQSLLAFIAPAQIDRINAAAAAGTVMPFSGDDPSQSIVPATTRRPPLPVRLIIVDSIAAPFRVSHASDSAGFVKRAEELGEVGDQLKRLAHVYNCAVVVVNQVSDVFERGPPRPLPPHPPVANAGPTALLANDSLSSTPSSTAPSTPLVPLPAHEQNGLPANLYSRFQTPHFSGQTPDFRSTAAMGHSWSNIVNTRLMLWRTNRRRRRVHTGGGEGVAYQNGNTDADEHEHEGEAELVRKMALVFSPFAPRATVEYVIREEGVVSSGEVVVREPKWVPRLAHEPEDDAAASRQSNHEEDEEEGLWQAVGAELDFADGTTVC